MPKPADPSVSLLARLRNVARQQNLPVDTMLLLYTQQGFLARLDRSLHSEQFVVKGGMSLYARYRSAARPTQDLDLAARHLPNTPEGIHEALIEIVMQPFPDSLTFDPADITTREMQIESEYQGVAAQVTATVGRARQTLPIDVSFGNVITPAPVTLAFPSMLVTEEVNVRVYPLETVVAEKFAALCELGLVTTRMKDIYDLWVITRRETLDPGTLKRAVTRAFTNRNTPPATEVLSDGFAADPEMQRKWSQYIRRTGLEAPGEFAQVMADLRPDLTPVQPD